MTEKLSTVVDKVHMHHFLCSMSTVYHNIDRAILYTIHGGIPINAPHRHGHRSQTPRALLHAEQTHGDECTEWAKK